MHNGRSNFLPGQVRPLLECAEPCAECMRCTRSELMDELGDPAQGVALVNNRNSFLRDPGASVFPDAFAFVDYDPDIHGFFWDH